MTKDDDRDREALAAQIGADGRQLLQAACAPDAPAWLREVPAVEALRHALHALAAVVPDWVRQQCPGDWAERYGPRLGDYRLPLDLAARQALAAQLGADGRALLRAVYAPGAPAWLRELPAVEALRRIWVQQYYAPDDTGAVRWREDRDRPPGALRIASPHDLEARYGTKRSVTWTGYKVQCDSFPRNWPAMVGG